MKYTVTLNTWINYELYINTNKMNSILKNITKIYRTPELTSLNAVLTVRQHLMCHVSCVVYKEKWRDCCFCCMVTCKNCEVVHVQFLGHFSSYVGMSTNKNCTSHKCASFQKVCNTKYENVFVLENKLNVTHWKNV